MAECPRCHKEYKEWPALSRRDNHTKICPACGTREAFEDMGWEVYEGPPYWRKQEDGDE